MWAFFVDRSDPRVIGSFKKLEKDSIKTMSLFYITDEFPINMADHLEALVSQEGPNVRSKLDSLVLQITVLIRMSMKV